MAKEGPQDSPIPEGSQDPPVHQGPQAPQQSAPHMPPLHQSHFKPKFSGKPEDAGAHLLRTNDWMDTHRFQEDDKVQRFCLILTGEARLWYESLILINIDWTELQNSFRQQYSKIGNTREQLLYARRSFHFDKNTETIDTYMHHITQVATLLGYGEPQTLEVFKNTLPTRLYWVLFPSDDLQLVVQIVKRILTKEKIDRQLLGQSCSTPFMNIQEEHNKRVTFNMTGGLEQKIDKHTVMMGKLVMKDNGQNRQFKPGVYQTNRGRGKTRHNYEQ